MLFYNVFLSSPGINHLMLLQENNFPIRNPFTTMRIFYNPRDSTFEQRKTLKTDFFLSIVLYYFCNSCIFRGAFREMLVHIK